MQLFARAARCLQGAKKQIGARERWCGNEGVAQVRSCPGDWLHNAKNRWALFTEWGLSCYCSGIAWGIVLSECFFLQHFVAWPHIRKEKWRSCGPSESFGTFYLHLRSRPCFWVFHFHPAHILIHSETFLPIIFHQNVQLSALLWPFLKRPSFPKKDLVQDSDIFWLLMCMKID